MPKASADKAKAPAEFALTTHFKASSSLASNSPFKFSKVSSVAL